MSRSLWILTLVALTACASVQPASEQSELAVQQASDRFWATRERGDARSFADQFTEDGILMIPGLADASGRTAIRELSEKRFPGTPTSDFKIQRREIQVAGDSAWELAWYEETYRGNDPVRMRGRYLIVWKRASDGVWRVHRNLYNFSGTVPPG
jgi:uncharacterized protein (TIGR02246 family)